MCCCDCDRGRHRERHRVQAGDARRDCNTRSRSTAAQRLDVAARCRKLFKSLAASTERLLCHEADIRRLQSTLPWQREKSPVGVRSSHRGSAASQRQDRRCAPDSAGFAIGRHPPPIAGFLGLKNKLSLQGLAGEVLTICKRGCSTGVHRLNEPSSGARLRHLSVRGDRDHRGQAVPAPSQRTPNRR